VRAGDSIPASELKHFIKSYCNEITNTWRIKPSALLREMRTAAVKLAKDHRS
jgi:hypothetical protein